MKVPISIDCVFDASLVPETCPARFLDLKGLINKFLESRVIGEVDSVEYRPGELLRFRRLSEKFGQYERVLRAGYSGAGRATREKCSVPFSSHPQFFGNWSAPAGTSAVEQMYFVTADRYVSGGQGVCSFSFSKATAPLCSSSILRQLKLFLDG